MGSYRSRTVKAIGWGLGSNALSQVFSILIGIMLARLLVPEDFGLIAMVLVVIRFAGLMADVGLGSALVQKKEITEDHLNSVFWINNLIGAILMGSVMLLSSGIAAFYARPELELISVALSVNFVVSSLAMVPRTRLARDLAFRELSIIDMLAMFIAGAVAISMAMKGFGYWSLVAHQLVERMTGTFLVWIVGRWRPRLKHNIWAVRELIGFSSSVFITRTLRYTAFQFDKLLIGKFLDATSLGLYDKAYSMMLFPLQNISHVVGGIMFPSLSQIQDDKLRVRDVYLRLTRAISMLTFPMLAGMFVVSEYFVLGVLGEQWSEMIPLFRMFCLVGLFLSIATITGSVYLSQGQAKLQLKVNLFTQPLQVIGVIIGLYWGLDGVVIGFAITSIVGVFVTWKVSGSLIALSVLQIMRNLLPTFGLSLLMACIVWLCGILLNEYGPLSKFLLLTLIGLATYCLLLWLIKPLAYQDIQKVLTEEFIRKRNIENKSM